MGTRPNLSPLSIAVVGATGMVGREFIDILQQRNCPTKELKLFATKESAGQTIEYQQRTITVQEMGTGCFSGCDVAFFSAGSNISEEWAPKAVTEGAFVIDNSSAFRMKSNVPLVVPEVNGHRIPKKTNVQIIANPNCSTIQLVVVLKPLKDAFGINNVTVSTYQSVSGAGKLGVEELSNQTLANLNDKDEPLPRVFPHPIAFNNIPQIDVFEDSGFTFEEKKIMLETQKILEIPDLDISATAVRTPTLNSHSEAVWVELKKDVTRDELIRCLENASGLVILDNIKNSLYPLNRQASGKDEVFVGRIRKDFKNPRRWVMWIVSDNVRKGAALNGIQIAEKLFSLS